MSLSIREASLKDAAILTEIYLAAFEKDEISLQAFPRTDKSYNFWYDAIIEEMASSDWHFICCYPTSDTSQTPIAYSKWNSPTDKRLPGPEDLPQWPEGSDAELANHFFGTLVSKRKENMGERKHWYLELLATRPEWQGKGAGSKMLKWGLGKADEEGLEAYLEASPAGKRLYEKMGFKEIGRLVVPSKKEGGEDFVECFMLRDARKKN
ncbi:Acyl-CoA N-acyltransferases (Nat) [Glarea lozoyensis ATCC 20868]|uniref:Acyl-CoA N-acyltransferases (Nat) n=1 Tax=Glarea lozoyensis (strain ATCC 20868 / MF5171) TaxID=1116229 RepID=S3DDV6_GLAL2|nr:Acyl-CoA N-acyltransferases (Nat) [Glarea lozoyensis ATCC 20868]EPE30171.1 Acyl-CoA N-acyltransferases (Nat) [Glarea lozoyensis ATCC 20868]